jgi:hypothetical protein
MRNTADVTGGKPIVVLLQSISGVQKKESSLMPIPATWEFLTFLPQWNMTIKDKRDY